MCSLPTFVKKTVNLMLKETLEMMDFNFSILQMSLLKPREGMGLLYQGQRDNLSNSPRSYVFYYLIQDDTIARFLTEKQRPGGNFRAREQYKLCQVHWMYDWPQLKLIFS